MELGAKGYLSKMATVDEIVRAVETVAAGGTAFPIAARRAASDALRVPTPRELEILALVTEGLSNAEIADRLSLRVKTVESQLRRLFDRYDVDEPDGARPPGRAPGLDRGGPLGGQDSRAKAPG